MPDAFDSPVSMLNATEVHRNEVGPGLIVVRIRPDSGVVPEFEPGQFATLGLPAPPDLVPPATPEPGATPSVPPAVHAASVRPGRENRVRLVRRAYSIASAATVRDHYEFYLVLVPEGRLTPRLWKLNTGGRLWMDGKAGGSFTLHGVPPEKDLVMVATGTGIAPFISMLRTYRGMRRWRRMVIVHGTRQAADLGYRAELEEAARDDTSVIYIPTVTREPPNSGWCGMCGRVHAVLEPAVYQNLVGDPLDPAHTEVFLCGNPAMITDVEALLTQRGFTTATREKPGNIHFERYW